MNVHEIATMVSRGKAYTLTYRELKREARRRFWEKTVSLKAEGDSIERMPLYALLLYVNGEHPHFT